MTKEENSGNAVSTTLYTDNYKMNAQQSDLTAFCKLLNETFAYLVKRGFIELRSITHDMVEAVAQFDAEPIIEFVQKAYNDEATKIKYERARLDFLKGKDNAADEITAAIESAKKQYESNALKYYKAKEDGYWRLRYLQVEDGFVFFDRALLIDDCKAKVRNIAHEAFIQKAHDLYTQLSEFEKECLRISGGAVHGIAYVFGGDALITINEEGKLILDVSYTSKMHFPR